MNDMEIRTQCRLCFGPVDLNYNCVAGWPNEDHSTNTSLKGWICPNCGKGLAPHVDSCCKQGAKIKEWTHDGADYYPPITT